MDETIDVSYTNGDVFFPLHKFGPCIRATNILNHFPTTLEGFQSALTDLLTGKVTISLFYDLLCKSSAPTLSKVLNLESDNDFLRTEFHKFLDHAYIQVGKELVPRGTIRSKYANMANKERQLHQFLELIYNKGNVHTMLSILPTRQHSLMSRFINANLAHFKYQDQEFIDAFRKPGFTPYIEKLFCRELANELRLRHLYAIGRYKK